MNAQQAALRSRIERPRIECLIVANSFIPPSTPTPSRPACYIFVPLHRSVGQRRFSGGTATQQLAQLITAGPAGSLEHMVLDFLQSTLQEDPAARPTAAALLGTPLMQHVQDLQSDLRDPDRRSRFLTAALQCHQHTHPGVDTAAMACEFAEHCILQPGQQQQQQSSGSTQQRGASDRHFALHMVEADAAQIRAELAAARQPGRLQQQVVQLPEGGVPAHPARPMRLQLLDVPQPQQAQLFGVPGGGRGMVRIPARSRSEAPRVVLSVPAATGEYLWPEQ
jgi:hypothetical protein